MTICISIRTKSDHKNLGFQMLNQDTTDKIRSR